MNSESDISDVEVATLEEFQKIKSDLARDAKSEYRQNPSEGLPNRDLHYYERDDLIGHGEVPSIIHHKFEMHPGENSVGGQSSEILTIDELPDFDHHVLKNKAQKSSTPFVNSAQITFRRPETNVASMNDFHVFDPAIVEMFNEVPEAGVDFDLLYNDLKNNENVPKKDLEDGTQKGIDDVRDHKSALNATKRDVRTLAEEILREIGQYEPEDQQALRQRSPMGVYHYIEEEVESWIDDQNGRIGQVRAKNIRQDLIELEEMALDLDDDTEVLEDESIDVFEDTVTQGFVLPGVDQNEDVIDEFGVGSLDYLLID